MKIAVCFLTHKRENHNLERWIIQAVESKLHNVDLYEYVNTDGEYTIEENVISFNFDDLREKYHWPYIYDNGGNGVGTKESTIHLPWLDMYSNHKGEYDIYLFMEDDIAYYGNENFFDRIDFNCDAIFAVDRVLMSDHYWCWSSDDAYLNSDVIKDHWHGLCNIFGYTGWLIDELMKFIEEENHAHFEWLLSSFAMNHNITIHTLSSYMKVFNSFNRGELPNSPFFELVHPIKSPEEYETYLNIINEN